MCIFSNDFCGQFSLFFENFDDILNQLFTPLPPWWCEYQAGKLAAMLFSTMPGVWPITLSHTAFVIVHSFAAILHTKNLNYSVIYLHTFVMPILGWVGSIGIEANELKYFTEML